MTKRPALLWIVCSFLHIYATVNRIHQSLGSAPSRETTRFSFHDFLGIKECLMEAMDAEDVDLTLFYLHFPLNTKRESLRLFLRLLQRRPSAAYVVGVFAQYEVPPDIVHGHLKYYLPTSILHQIFPDKSDWESDEFLKAVVLTRSSYKAFGYEKLYANLFFDRAKGLFGEDRWNGMEGGAYYEQFFVEMLCRLESAGRLTPSPQLDTLKRDLAQAAATMKPDRKEYGAFELPELLWELDADKITDELRRLPIGETYLLNIFCTEHTGYALVRKKSTVLVNVKVFERMNRCAGSRRSPLYHEWDELPLEEFLARCTKRIGNPALVLSETIKPDIPATPLLAQTARMQLTGTCSCHKFWLLAQYDLETLPAFMELRVGAHLDFIERLAKRFKKTMGKWGSVAPRAWLAITRTPHFEGRLLKELESIRCEDPRMYEKLRHQIVESVQHRYDLPNAEFTVAAIKWRKRLLASVGDEYNLLTRAWMNVVLVSNYHFFILIMTLANIGFFLIFMLCQVFEANPYDYI